VIGKTHAFGQDDGQAVECAAWAAVVAAERRLSRFLIHARKPG
jgi:hypothetical protein